MAIIHIVLFSFKSELQAQELHTLCEGMLALQKECLHPETKQPYIKSIQGGSDNSPEGAQRGMTHGFVVEFESEKDRDYYVHEDPAHKAFKQAARGKHAGPTVLDFEPGKF